MLVAELKKIISEALACQPLEPARRSSVKNLLYFLTTLFSSRLQTQVRMTKYTFFTIQNGIPYQQLKKPLTFQNDPFGITNWVLRQPLTIYSKDLHERHVFTEDSVAISPHTGTIEEERWKYFVTTTKDGEHLYCTAQVFYERAVLTDGLSLRHGKVQPLSQQREEFYIPKCLVFMSNEPYFKIHVNLLRIYRQILKPQGSLSHPISPKIISNYLSLKAQGRSDDFNLWQSPQTGRNAKVGLILDYYMEKVNQQSGRQSLLIQKFTNLPVLHLYSLRSDNLFQLSHFFNLPLCSETLAVALTAILLEKQLILASKSNNLNVMVIETLLQIIKPLRWQHMVVHNLPPHLFDAANENFMPFIVGVNQKYLQELHTENRFVLLVDEDRIIKPQVLPEIGPALDDFCRQIKRSSPSVLVERYILANSIQFICQLVKSVYQGDQPQSQNQFYTQFKQTSLYCVFTQMLENNKLSEFRALLRIEQVEERKMRIEKQLNDLTYYFQNPRFIVNELEWIQYYLSRTNPNLATGKKEKQNKLLSLREIKQSIINHNRPKICRKPSAITRIRSQIGAQPRTSKSGQKIKVSMVKHHCHPLLSQLLEQRLGVGIQLA